MQVKIDIRFLNRLDAYINQIICQGIQFKDKIECIPKIAQLERKYF